MNENVGQNERNKTETIPSPRIWTIVYGLRMTGPLTIDATLPQ